MSSVGCLIVAYQRTVELETVLNLVDSEKFDRIFIVIDQPKHRTEESLKRFECVTQIALGFASSRDYVNVKIRSTNYGIVKNFQDAIAECFLQIDVLCILEDDCIPSVGIKNYINEVLALPLDCRIKIYTLTRPKIFPDFGGFELTHSPLMWGWVVSRQNWNLISSFIGEKHIPGVFPFPRVLFQSFLYSAYYRANNNSLDALDALIAYVFSSQDFLTLIPPSNLASNVGTGPLATNTILESAFHHAKVVPWNSAFIGKPPKVKIAKIFVNDFLIFRKMNGWKIHHSISNYLRIRLFQKR